MSWEFIGNSWAVDFLEKNIAAGNSHQAYLICGPDSIGKRTLALQLSQRLLCDHPQDGPCRQCEPCRQTAQKRHPDFHWLEADEVDGTLKVEAIREMQRQIALAPYQAYHRVVLILRAHEMSQSAANALLKTLEEPPSQVVLILTARSEQSLLPTLVSRCEQITLRPVPQAQIFEALQPDMGPEKAKLLGSLSAGLPGIALRLAADGTALPARLDALSKLEDMMAADLIGRFSFADELTKGRDLALNRRRVLDLLEVWLSFWRDVMLTSYGAEVELANPDKQAAISEIAGQVSSAQAAEIVTKTASVMTGVTQNANLQLSMETVLLSLPKPRQ